MSSSHEGLKARRQMITFKYPSLVLNTGLGDLLDRAPVNPDDNNDLPAPTRALRVGAAGDLTVKLAGVPVRIRLHSVPSGMVLPISVTRVYATGTTAGDILAEY